MFQPRDEGPFWMLETERDESRHDIQLDERSEVECYKADLIIELGSEGISTKGENKKELIVLCNKNAISSVTTVQKM